MPDRIDFKQLAQDIDIAEVAHLLKLEPHKDRFACPVCDNDRAIQLFPETNSFRCHIAKISGDCISLYAHANGYVGQYKAAKELNEHFSATAPAVRTAPSTTPQKPVGKKQLATAPEAKGFDKEKFADSLGYDGEVEELTEAVAQRHRIGTKRNKLYVPICPPDVEPVCWAELHEGKLRLPDSWLSNVVKLKRA